MPVLSPSTLSPSGLETMQSKLLSDPKLRGNSVSSVLSMCLELLQRFTFVRFVEV